MSAARIRLIRGDITKVPADAVVNAANSGLCGGGGVDGAIHRAGGPAIMAELSHCRPKGGCPPGGAVVTGAGNLPAKWVVHAVGPVWRGGFAGEDDILADAYKTSLRLAAEKGAATVSFPSISTGAYGFPVERAAGIAVRAVAAGLEARTSVREAVFVLYDGETYAAYEAALAALKEAPGA